MYIGILDFKEGSEHVVELIERLDGLGYDVFLWRSMPTTTFSAVKRLSPACFVAPGPLTSLGIFQFGFVTGKGIRVVQLEGSHPRFFSRSVSVEKFLSSFPHLAKLIDVPRNGEGGIHVI